MWIMLNGEPYEAPDGINTISGLLSALGVMPEGVAVECNYEIIRRSEFGSREVNEGDTIEIVRFVGGG